MERAGKQLRRGITTGTCAQAAAKAAAICLLSGEVLHQVTVTLPKGETIQVPIQGKKEVVRGGEKGICCWVEKDSGDDPDITNHVLVYSTVFPSKEKGIQIEGGEGIGRVTKPGLNQKVGEAAINSVPRNMIRTTVAEVLEAYPGPEGIKVVVSIPAGKKLAAKTFNPRLGIVGGISVLGTTGIVQPMSEQALVDTIAVEMNVKCAQGYSYLLAAPGNYGLDFLKEQYNIPATMAIKCSNYVGETLDLAYEKKVKGMVFVAHIGKFVKVGGGIMNTHSKMADCRMEILSCCALQSGVSREKVLKILMCSTTEEALEVFSKEELSKVIHILMDKIIKVLRQRTYGTMEVGVVLFSSQKGLLGMSDKAEEMLMKIKEYR